MPKVETFDREEILGKVIQLFHEKGYNATSMQDLVDVTGLNRSSIYNSFGSKMELYQESLKAYKAIAEKTIQKYLIHSETPLETIRNIFSLNPQCTSNGCMLSNCTTEMANKDPKIKNFLVHNKEGMEDLFESLVEKGQKEGSINTKKTPREYGLYLFASLQGFRITGIIIEEQKDLESIVNTVLSVLE